MFEKQISQSLQDAIKKITSVSEALIGNQHRIDKNKNGKIDAHDFKLLKGQKAAPMKEDPDWVIIEQDEDNTTAKVAGHKVTLHRSLSEPGASDTYTLHHPSGDKKVKISYDTHGDGEEIHGDKVNHAFGLDSKHKLGHKIAGSMNGMGGISKFEEELSLSTSSSLLNEYKKDKPNDIESSAYTPEKNSDGKTLTTRLYAKEYKNRAAQHEKDLNRKNATPEDKKEDKGHMERANAAHEAHTHAINVHHSPTASPNEKQDAVKKAVHAQLKYWKHGPMSHTDARSDRGEQDYYTSHKRYLEHPDMKSIKEEVEELDELSKTTLGSYAKKATRDAVITRKIGADFEHQSKRAKSPGVKAASDELSQKWKEKSWKRRDGVDKAVDRLTKEEVEQNEYTFADYLDAVRAQYGDEDAVLIANEAFKNQDITLFSDQSQSPEA